MKDPNAEEDGEAVFGRVDFERDIADGALAMKSYKPIVSRPGSRPAIQSREGARQPDDSPTLAHGESTNTLLTMTTLHNRFLISCLDKCYPSTPQP